MSCWPRWNLVPSIAFIVALFLASSPAQAQKSDTKRSTELAGFKTVDSALTTTIRKTSTTQVGSPAYLGVSLTPEAGMLVVSGVDDHSPAAKAGLLVGDVLLKIDGKPIKSAEVFRTLLQTKNPGELAQMTVQRDEESRELTAKLIATSRVMQPGQQRAIMGVLIDDTVAGPGATLKTVTAGMPAEKAGLRAGDVILKIDGQMLSAGVRLNDVMFEKNPGDVLALLIKAQGKEKTVKVQVVAEQQPKGFKAKAWDTRGIKTWRKDVYNLAIVCVEFPDVKHNDKITSKDWQDALFSEKTYNTTSVTGQKVFGSLRDYYLEQSFNKLHVEGKCFDFVTVGKKRSDYAAAMGNAKTALLGEALDKLYERDGKDVLDGYDGIFFLYAGERVQTNRGGLYWPHRATFNHKGKPWSYYIVQEGGAKMCDISVICHEFGHMLGLPDLYEIGRAHV